MIPITLTRKENKERIDTITDFSGPDVTEFGLDLNTDQLRNMSPTELEYHLHREARRRRQHRE